MTSYYKLIWVCAVLLLGCSGDHEMDSEHWSEPSTHALRTDDVIFQGRVAERLSSAPRAFFGTHAGCADDTRSFTVIETLAGPAFGTSFSVKGYNCRAQRGGSVDFGRGNMRLPRVGTKLLVFLTETNAINAIEFLGDGYVVNAPILRQIASFHSKSDSARIRWLRQWLASRSDLHVIAALKVIASRGMRRSGYAANAAVEEAVVNNVLRLDLKNRSTDVRVQTVTTIMSLGLLGRRGIQNYDRAIKLLVGLASSDPVSARPAIGVLLQLRRRLNPRSGGYNPDGSFPSRSKRTKASFVTTYRQDAASLRAWHRSGGHHKRDVDVAHTQSSP